MEPTSRLRRAALTGALVLSGCQTGPLGVSPTMELDASVTAPADPQYELFMATSAANTQQADSRAIPYCVFAGSSSRDVQLCGGKNVLEGNVHSNCGVSLTGDHEAIVGVAHSVKGCDIKGQRAGVREKQISRHLSWAAPVSCAGWQPTFHFDHDTDISDEPRCWDGPNKLKPGIYECNGKLKLSRSNCSGRVTFKADCIELSGHNQDLAPFKDNVLCYAMGKDERALHLASSSSHYAGLCLAYNGGCEISGRGNWVAGMVECDHFKLSGSSNRLCNRGQSFCEPRPKPCPTPTPKPPKPCPSGHPGSSGHGENHPSPQPPHATPTPVPHPTATPTPHATSTPAPHATPTVAPHVSPSPSSHPTPAPTVRPSASPSTGPSPVASAVATPVPSPSASSVAVPPPSPVIDPPVPTQVPTDSPLPQPTPVPPVPTVAPPVPTATPVPQPTPTSPFGPGVGGSNAVGPGWHLGLGGFGNIFGLAFDSTGNLWAGAGGTQGMGIEYDFGGNQLGSHTLGVNSWGVAVEPGNGRIWYTDQGSGTVTVLNADRTLAFQANLGGFTPEGIVFDKAGRPFITDQTNNSVDMLDPATGAIQAKYPVGLLPRDLVFDANGHLWVTNNGTHTVTELDAAGVTVGTYPTGENPSRIAIDGAGNFWITNTGPDIPYPAGYVPGNTVTKLTAKGDVAGTFTVGNSPYGVAFDTNGNTLVVNTGDNSVTKLSPAGVTLATYTSAEGIGNQPYNIAMDAYGYAWISNHGSSSLTVLLP